MASEWGPGRNITTEDGKRFWAGMWYAAWGEHGLSPLWVAARSVGTSLASLCSRLEEETGREVLTMGKWAVQPLALGFGLEEQDVEAGLLHDIKGFGVALDRAGVSTSAGLEMYSEA
jgi:hypothetical protein